MKTVYFTIPVILFLATLASTNFVIAQSVPSKTDVGLVGPIPFPSDLKNMTLHFCNTMLGAGGIDPQVLQFVIANNPNAIKNINDSRAEKSIISAQFWEILERKLIAATSEFSYLNGTTNSIVFPPQNETSNLMCPGTWGLNGTFESNDGTKYKFEFSANDYNYEFIPIAQTSGKTVPEFPFTIPILLISITSFIVFYRIKFGK